MMRTKVSLIIPCYNQGQFLNDALESVYNQTYSEWECIIVNDGSHDNTEDIAREWTAKDNRFQYFYKENAGVSSARNLGIEKAKGKYLQFLDADDIIDEKKIELSLLELNDIPEERLKIVISNFRMFIDIKNTVPPFCNLNDQLLNLDSLLCHWNVSFSIPVHCGFFNSTLFETIRFPENLSAQEDWVVWVSLFKSGCEAMFIDKPLAFYRINPSSRMMTKGLDDNQVKAIALFKTILDEKEYGDFSLNLISRYYNLNENHRSKLIATKKSYTYQTGLMVKKILKAMGILKPAKTIFKVLLKFKAKYKSNL